MKPLFLSAQRTLTCQGAAQGGHVIGENVHLNVLIQHLVYPGGQAMTILISAQSMWNVKSSATS